MTENRHSLICNSQAVIPISEQAAALLNAQTLKLAEMYCDGDLAKLEKSWSITISDLHRYVEEYGLPNGWIHTQPATFDGVYLLKSETKWLVYEQERGRKYTDSMRLFESYDQALNYVLWTYYMPKSHRHENPDS